jgi:hypothetical protein
MICRYHGSSRSYATSPDPGIPGASLPVTGNSLGTLAAAATVHGAPLTALASALNAGRRVGTGAMSCPADNGASLYIAFGYRDATTVTVQIELSGCQIATNGVGHWFLTPSAQHQITQLVGTDPTP